MGFAIFALIIGLMLLLAANLLNSREQNKIRTSILRYAGIGGIIIFIVISLTTMFYVINPGEVGVEVLFGSVQRYAENGLHFKNPLSSVIVFDIKTQREAQRSEGASQDLQLVIVESVVNYHLDSSKIPELYSKIGRDFVHKVIIPAIQECTKAATAKYKVEEVIVKRHEVKQLIFDSLKSKLANYYIVLEDVNIQDIDFSPEFNRVVEEKQIEEQKIKTAQYRREQAEQDKERTILEAQAEAEKQRLLKVNTSKEVVELKWIEKWDGKLPQTILGDNSVPMINLNK
ncbi:MAG: prohibitin family protein [Bacteroidota bacterium]